MNKTTKIVIAIIVIVVLVVAGVLIFGKNKGSNSKDIDKINELLQDEAVQNDLLERVITDCKKDMKLDAEGEYRLIVQADRILNMLLKEILLDTSFVDKVEENSDNPSDVYLLGYEYDETSATLKINVRGILKNLDTKENTYSLYIKNGEIEYDKESSQTIPYEQEQSIETSGGVE